MTGIFEIKVVKKIYSGKEQFFFYYSDPYSIVFLTKFSTVAVIAEYSMSGC